MSNPPYSVADASCAFMSIRGARSTCYRPKLHLEDYFSWHCQLLKQCRSLWKQAARLQCCSEQGVTPKPAEAVSQNGPRPRFFAELHYRTWIASCLLRSIMFSRSHEVCCRLLSAHLRCRCAANKCAYARPSRLHLHILVCLS